MDKMDTFLMKLTTWIVIAALGLLIILTVLNTWRGFVV